MKFTVEKNWINVVGTIWMPAVTATYTYQLTQYDMENIGEPTRENVETWLSTHAGYFQSIKDFHALVGETEIPWKDEENEFLFNSITYPEEV